MTADEKKALLSCGLFEDMDALARQRLLGCLGGTETRYEKNELLWNIGDPLRACAVVLSGSVRAESVNTSGTHSLMACHKAGALLGDVLMATPGKKSPVYVIAAEPTTVIFFSFSKIMTGCPRCCPAHAKLRENLISEIAQKFWAQRRRLDYLAEGSLRVRIAMFLTDRSKAVGSTVLALGITREDLAAFLQVNRSALSREISRMKQEGLIDCSRDRFVILDAKSMEDLLP